MSFSNFYPFQSRSKKYSETKKIMKVSKNNNLNQDSSEDTVNDTEGSKSSAYTNNEENFNNDDHSSTSRITRLLNFCLSKLGNCTSASKFHANSTFVEEDLGGPSHPTDSIYDINTFGDFLKQSGLTELLQELETSLEDLRRNKKSITEHEVCFHKNDKELQKLSFNYHPDTVQRSGGTEEELRVAQQSQAALNATRAILRSLNSVFTEDTGFYHKFGFYMQLKISTLNNEDQIKKHVHKFIFKFGKISQIKQQDITSEIRKFLIESQNYVNCYLNEDNNFKKHGDLALFHLECCINGFEKLCEELEKIKLQCLEEEDGENMHSFIQTMFNDTKKDLEVLKSLQINAKASLNGNYGFFSPEGDMDPYFVLPLVSYTNVTLMCNAMIKGAPYFNLLNFLSKSDPHCRDDLEYLMGLYYLVSYFRGNKHHENKVWEIVMQLGLSPVLNEENIKSAFRKTLEQIKEVMEAQFKIDNYKEVNTTNSLIADLEKCTAMINKFQNLEKNLSKYIDNFQNKIEKMDEMDERIDELNKDTEEMDLKIKKVLEQNKIMREKCPKKFSKQQQKMT